MSNNASSFAIGSGLSLNTPQVINVDISLVDTEQEITLPAATKFFRLRNNGNKILKLSYTPTESGTVFYTIFPQDPHEVNGIAADSVKLYVQSPGLINIQIETWR